MSVDIMEVPFRADDRDAVHVAVISGVCADDGLSPGDTVTVIDGKVHKTVPSLAVGVLNPFVFEKPAKGDLVWVCLFPNSITNLRHHWQHPMFDDAEPERKCTKEESEAWLRDFVKRSDCPDYDTLIEAASDSGGSGYEFISIGSKYYLMFYCADAHGDIPPEFWDHVENVTGKKCVDRPTRFTCSC